MVLAILSSISNVPRWLVLPFGLLLLAIAIVPLSSDRIKLWWEHNYGRVAIGLGALVAAFYLWQIPEGGSRVAHTMHEYVSFIGLIGSLYVVAGGIHLKVKGEATPLVNVVFLFVGAVLANLIGTTGASMVLIRPFIRMNKIRVSTHHVVFFIFLVSNVGGALTPIGDPPLFLGYLRGVPFFWLPQQVFAQWLLTIGAILIAFYVFDRRSFKHAPRKIQEQIAHDHEEWRFDGKINLIFLALVIGAVFVPERFFLREITMLGAAFASYRLTSNVVHQENHFSFGPIKEVALLFAGIFATMLPALDYLEAHGQEFNFTKPAHYYYASGALSSVLDNAPTYANFFELAAARTVAAADKSTPAPEERSRTMQLLAEAPQLIIAVSLGSVFFGAMTYIGNGPNFMVKSIAHNMGAHTPDFFAYIYKFSLPILLPILIFTAWLFL
jgi:Na+/H+ antiporter NhaD/arsenite permease-like protein